MTSKGLKESDGHCDLCHALKEAFTDEGLVDGCCCCRVHKEHGGMFPPIEATLRLDN